MSDRITAAQRQILEQLPRWGQEWLDVALWSPRGKLSLQILAGRGLVILWYAPELHARLSLDGQSLLNRMAVE